MVFSVLYKTKSEKMKADRAHKIGLVKLVALYVKYLALTAL